MDKHAQSDATSPSDPSAVSMSMLQGATDFKIKDSILTNVQGNLTIFRFDGNEPLSAEFNSLLVKHLTGSITVQDIDKVEKRVLIQSIRDLPRAGAAYDDYAPKKEHASCLKGTREAILKEIAGLIGSSEMPQIFLLSGLVGTGKSTIAHTVAERADNLRCLGASFFFSMHEEERRNAKKFFTTIAYQLCMHDKKFAEAIGDVLLTERGSAAISKGPQEQLEVLILEPLRGVTKMRSRPKLIVIDALDECDPADRTIVLTTLNQLVLELPSFKVVLTTRPYPHLQRLLESLDNHMVFDLQDVKDDVVNNDIRLYLRRNLSREMVEERLPGLRAKWAADDEEIEHLVHAAGKLFLVASIALRFILDPFTYNPRSQMRAIKDNSRVALSGVGCIYSMILRLAIPSCHLKERFKVVIGTILFVQKPLLIGILEHFTCPFTADDIDATLKNLQSVIPVNGDVPRIYHTSFPDFLTDTNGCAGKDFLIDPTEQHTKIAIRCFRIMNGRLEQNIIGLRTPARFMENGAALAAEGIKDSQLQEKIPAELRYACMYWSSHVEGAEIGNVSLLGELRTFGTVHLLHWFEALSWINELSFAYCALHNVQKYLKSIYDIHEVFADGLRFISQFYVTMQRSALHTYYSALPFTPVKTSLHGTFNKDMGHNLCQLEGGLEQWGAPIATLDNGRWSKFSKDSSQLACRGPEDLKLWDANSGMPLKTFQGKVIAIAENFSRVASYLCGAVTLHDVGRNVPIHTSKYPTEVLALNLSFDGNRLAVGLSDGTVCLWNAEKGSFMKSFGGYARDSVQLAFLPSGYGLIIRSGGGSTHLWDGDDGKFIASLNHESEQEAKLAFSYDGSRIASTTVKDNVRSLRLWNGKNGEFIGVARNVGSLLSISPEGSLVAMGEMGKVELWSGTSFSLVDTLDIGERTNIYSLAFSNDRMLAIGSDLGVTLHDLRSRVTMATFQFSLAFFLVFSPDRTRLAAGNWYDTTQLWDVSKINVSIPPSGQQSCSVTALAFSTDSSLLAVGFKDGAVTLRATDHTVIEATAADKRHSLHVTALAFSPDDEQFASGSRDETVRVWNGRDGSSIGHLEYAFSNTVTSVAFSRSALAAATYYSITLWDRKTLCLIHICDQRSDLLSLSPVGSLLAFAYNRYTVHPYASDVVVWDTERRTSIATFNVNASIKGLAFSSDGSRLAAQLHNGSFQSFDVFNKEVVQNTGREDLGWIPHWNGILVSLGYDGNNVCHVLGRLPGYCAPVPILYVPRDVHIESCAIGSFIFAFGLTDGRILMARFSTVATVS